MIKKISIIVLALGLFLTHFSAVFAVGEIAVDDGTIVPGLGTFHISTFLDLSKIKNFSVFSYLALGIQIIFLLLVIYWIIKVVVAGVGIMRDGEEGLEKGKKKISAVIASILILFVFVIVISVVSGFFGVGNFFQWPKFFSQCTTTDSEGRTRYYFGVYAQNSKLDNAEKKTDDECL